LPLSDNYGDAFDNRRFPAAVLKKALAEALSPFGPTWQDVIFVDMAKSGIIFDNKATYSINQIRPYFYSIFNHEMGDVLLNKVRRALSSLE
jgi:hypothetical protein